MPRVARIVVPDVPHHVTQRGNNQEKVFFSDEDRIVYLKILKDQCDRYSVAVLGYCLMANHVHLIAVPKRAESLAKAIGRTNWIYANHLNRARKRSGHLWQSRFYSNAMDDDHCLLAMRYVEWNPIRAGICQSARKYPWSSAAAHCGGKDTAGLLDLAQWNELTKGVNWEAAIKTEPTEQEISSVRRSLHTGRPLMGEGLMKKLERKLGQTLHSRPRGRPKKATRGVK
jgi:putative transposase